MGKELKHPLDYLKNDIRFLETYNRLGTPKNPLEQMEDNPQFRKTYDQFLRNQNRRFPFLKKKQIQPPPDGYFPIPDEDILFERRNKPSYPLPSLPESIIGMSALTTGFIMPPFEGNERKGQNPVTFTYSDHHLSYALVGYKSSHFRQSQLFVTRREFSLNPQVAQLVYYKQEMRNPTTTLYLGGDALKADYDKKGKVTAIKSGEFEIKIDKNTFTIAGKKTSIGKSLEMNGKQITVTWNGDFMDIEISDGSEKASIDATIPINLHKKIRKALERPTGTGFIDILKEIQFYYYSAERDDAANLMKDTDRSMEE